ncbi:DUF2058 family protein [Thiorhodospira sibirica]|uniref:DUF2058 family protein n=1 Tax=Thiorhodospira sibirica TaxID=154347 RepID=UPI00022C4CA6|nr:DUF2058 family protein [Thiorhodospira sibirica]
MTESLREQLIKAGLAKPHADLPSTEARRRGRPQQKQHKARPAAPLASISSSATEPVSPPVLVRADKAQLREFIAKHRCNDPNAEIAFYFQQGDKIKHLYVTAEQQQALAHGELAIALLDGRRNLLPREQAKQFLAMDPARIVIFIEPAADEMSNLQEPSPSPPVD